MIHVKYRDDAVRKIRGGWSVFKKEGYIINKVDINSM